MRRERTCAGLAEWQTRPTQNRLSERTCGFKSHIRHRGKRVPYVRSAYGEKAAWNRRARSGRPVAFTLADPELGGADAAFRAKYGHTPHIGSVVSDDARALTLRVEPA